MPLSSVLPRGSLAMENEAVSDSHMYWSSSLCLLVTTTRLATGEGGRGEGEERRIYECTKYQKLARLSPYNASHDNPSPLHTQPKVGSNFIYDNIICDSCMWGNFSYTNWV